MSSDRRAPPALTEFMLSCEQAEKPSNPERVEVLKNLGEYVASKVSTGQEARLVFVCTHNSRRSHMGAIAAAAAASHLGISG